MNTDHTPVRVGVVLDPRDIRQLDRAAAEHFATRSAFVRALILRHLKDRETAKSNEAAA